MKPEPFLTFEKATVMLEGTNFMLVPINEDINIDNLCDTTTPTRYIVEFRA